MKISLSKKLSIGVIVLLSPWLMNAQDKSAPLEVTLEEAIEIALSESPTIRIADQEIARVDYSKKSAWQNLLPTLDGTGQYSKYLVPGTMSLAGMKIDMPTDWNVSLGLQAALPLIAPGLWKSIQLSELDLQMTVEQARSSKINLRNQISIAYYNILLAQDSYKVLQDGYALAEENYKQAKKRFETGVAAEYDYLSAEVSMTNLQPQIVQVEHGIVQAKLLLKVLMGVEVSQTINTKGSLADYEGQAILLNAQREIDLTNNTDLKQLEIGQLQVAKAREALSTQFMPTLAAFGQYTYAGQGNKAMNSPLFGDRPASKDWFGQGLIVGVQLSVPIFHASNFTKLKQNKIQADELKLQQELLENTIKLQARTALDNMEKASKQVEVTKKAYTLAQKAYDISAKRYETGVSVMIELQQASVAVTQMGLSHEQAIADYLTAKADYEKIIGQQ
jgi:outer membrane protein TolC